MNHYFKGAIPYRLFQDLKRENRFFKENVQFLFNQYKVSLPNKDNGTSAKDLAEGFLQVVLTNKCNLKCEKCLRHCDKVTKETQWEYTLETFKRDWKNIYKYILKDKNVGLTGGDPFCCNYFYDIVRYLDKFRLQFIVINTNLVYLFKDENFNKFLELNREIKTRLTVTYTPYKVCIDKQKEVVDKLIKNGILTFNCHSRKFDDWYYNRYIVFFDSDIQTETYDEYEQHNNCYACPVVVPGKILKCELQMDELLEETDYIKIEDMKSDEEYIYNLYHPCSRCKHCAFGKKIYKDMF